LVISSIIDNNEINSVGDGAAAAGPSAAGAGGSFSSAISLTDTLPQANLRVSLPLTASSGEFRFGHALHTIIIHNFRAIMTMTLHFSCATKKICMDA